MYVEHVYNMRVYLF